MSHRIAISFAVAAVGILCIATDALARGGTGHGGGGPVGGVSVIKSYGPASPATKSYVSGPANKAYISGGLRKKAGGVGGPAGGGTVGINANGAGAAVRAPYYAPTSYYSNAACGYYPYPPCHKVRTQ
jgi:hypothetical protein